MNRYIKRPFIVTVLVLALLVLIVPTALASGGHYHTVYYGETLYSIGRHYGVNPYHIAEVNNLYNPNHIYAGQVLYIPVYGYYDGCYYDCYDGYGYQDSYYHDAYYGHHDKYMPANHHVVAYGETLSSIAYYYGVSPWSIAKANHLYNLNRIYAGQVLYIPGYGHYGY